MNRIHVLLVWTSPQVRDSFLSTSLKDIDSVLGVFAKHDIPRRKPKITSVAPGELLFRTEWSSEFDAGFSDHTCDAVRWSELKLTPEQKSELRAGRPVTISGTTGRGHRKIRTKFKITPAGTAAEVLKQQNRPTKHKLAWAA